eukprot:3498069-Karenia_brevis.AAC.1
MVDTMMTKHRGRRSQSEGSNDRSTEGKQKEELHRQVSLRRDLTTELDAVAEENREGTTAAATAVPHYPKDSSDKFVSPSGEKDDDCTT